MRLVSRGDRLVEQGKRRADGEGILIATDVEPVRRDAVEPLHLEGRDEFKSRQTVLQLSKVPQGSRREQIAVGRGALAVDDRERVGRRQEVLRELHERLKRDRAEQLAVGGVVEEVEPPLQDVGLVGSFARQSAAVPWNSGGSAEESGHRTGFGKADGVGLVDEVLDFLGGDQAVVIGVDQRQVVMRHQIVERDRAFDRGDGVAHADPRIGRILVAAEENLRRGRSRGGCRAADAADAADAARARGRNRESVGVEGDVVDGGDGRPLEDGVDAVGRGVLAKIDQRLRPIVERSNADGSG